MTSGDGWPDHGRRKNRGGMGTHSFCMGGSGLGRVLLLKKAGVLISVKGSAQRRKKRAVCSDVMGLAFVSVDEVMSKAPLVENTYAGALCDSVERGGFRWFVGVVVDLSGDGAFNMGSSKRAGRDGAGFGLVGKAIHDR